MNTFTAIDFETVTGYMDSACAIGIITVENGRITDEYHTLIQPPENIYWNSNIKVHGITPEMTQHSPGFHAIYPDIKERLYGRTVVAHNESFDRTVLKKTMRMYQLDYDELMIAEKWQCTCRIYRSIGFKPATLNACCEKMNIPLNHHEALSDARGCALLYLEYLEKQIMKTSNNS